MAVFQQARSVIGIVQILTNLASATGAAVIGLVSPV